jgi:hypothetical protein
MSGKLRFTPTEENLKAAYSLHLARFSVKRLLVMAALGMFVGLAVAGLSGTRNMNDVMLVTIGMLCWALVVTLVIYLTIRYFWIPRFARRVFAQQKDLQSETEISWDDRSFVAANANGSGSLPWADFHRWKQDEAALLLYRSEALFNFLPLSEPAFVQAAAEMVGHLRAAGVKRK